MDGKTAPFHTGAFTLPFHTGALTATGGLTQIPLDRIAELTPLAGAAPVTELAPLTTEVPEASPSHTGTLTGALMSALTGAPTVRPESYHVGVPPCPPPYHGGGHCAPPGIMRFRSDGQGAYKQEVSYRWVGRGGDFSVQMPNYRPLYALLCAGALFVLCLPLAILMVPTVLPRFCPQHPRTMSTFAIPRHNLLESVRRCFLSADGIHFSPNGKFFPEHWGAPPEIHTIDLVELPLEYGQGSGTLNRWIGVNIAKDNFKSIYYSPNGKQYPYHWGKPPQASGELVDLPNGYGRASSAEEKWIRQSIDKDARDASPYVSNQVSVLRDHAGIYYSPNGRVYPPVWGAPPLAETNEVVTLPGGFGQGSGTLAAWIRDHMARQSR